MANDILYELARTRDTQADLHRPPGRGGCWSCPASASTPTPARTAGTRMNIGFTVYALARTPLNVLKESVNSELYYSRIIFTLADRPAAGPGEHQ